MNGIKCLIKVSHSLLARNDLTFNSTMGAKASIVFILKEFNEQYYFLAQFRRYLLSGYYMQVFWGVSNMDMKVLCL